MIYFVRCLLLFSLLLIARHPQAQQYNFRSWTLEQGLPQSQITAITQDAQGFLWLATRGGLSRFDGINFRTYTKRDGLTSHNISAIHQDGQKRLWIGTMDAGLVLYNGVRFQSYGAAQGLPAKTIYAISEDTLGRVWLATGKGAYYFANGSFHRYTALPEGVYTAISHAADGTLWVGSREHGLYKISGKRMARYSTANSALPSNSITALSVAPSGALWIGTDKGLSRLQHGTLTTPALPSVLQAPAVSSFTYDAQGNVWVGLERNGLLRYTQGKFTHLTRRNGLRTPRISSLASDSEGNIWIGTNGYGLQQYKSPWFVHYFDFENMNEPRITALACDSSGTMWLGTDEGEFASMPKTHPNWQTHLPWPKGTTLNTIYPLNEQATWVCSSDGVWLLRPDTTLHYTTAHGLPSAEVYQAVADAAGTMWVATAGGLAYFQDSVFVPIAAPSGAFSKTNCLFRDSKNSVWVGAEDGVYQLRGHSIISPPALEGVKFSEVGSVAEDKLGNLYFAGFNQGILMLADSHARVFTAKDGLPTEAIKTLYIDKRDNMWVATSRNVLKLRLPQLRQDGQLNYRSYTSQNGFRGLEVCDNAMAQSPDGTMWFGTTKGLTQYLPSLDRRNATDPKVMLTDVMLYSKPTDWTALGYPTDSTTGLPENLRLPYNQNYLSFDFHAICLSGPEQVRYRYRLMGFDEQWSPPVEQSFTTYANLSPGTYTFELLARNNDGFWADEPVTYTFAIVPPIWRREWFVGVLLLVVAATVLSVVRLREQSLVKMNSLLEMRVNHRTRLLERKNREKEMLLQEIHHRVKNNLQIVISMLNLQARHVSDPLAAEVMQAIRSRVRSMSILHERLYQHADLDCIDLEEYFEEICESLYAAYGVTMSRIALEIDMPRIKVNIDAAITLGLIVNELISNSLKYAFPNGQAGVVRIVLVRHDAVQYTLTVSDNGQGLPHNFNPQTSQSFGLKLVTSLSRNLEGHFKFDNKNGTKSILYFVLAS
ncbi:ATP-binding protein [Pontibacter sp. E15-1]|uniref:two-component regulator propeller domain-containing protein n=1 Tax=Pontibacter sp. E15-1 TaxID=2919918 RepID=UPI001F4F22C5|nr:two-component regulator propeller domain-containing protein [Pontibacter sp. E15-1]MCJ8166880.1 ATP-binding protein [Pontibacter sp. E15-1]